MTKKSAVVLTTIAATGAGYIAGVLFAPKSGGDLRKEIKGRAKLAADKAAGHMQQGMDKIRGMVTHTKERAEDKAEEIQEAVRSPAAARSPASHTAV